MDPHAYEARKSSSLEAIAGILDRIAISLDIIVQAIIQEEED